AQSKVTWNVVAMSITSGGIASQAADTSPLEGDRHLDLDRLALRRHDAHGRLPRRAPADHEDLVLGRTGRRSLVVLIVLRVRRGLPQLADAHRRRHPAHQVPPAPLLAERGDVDGP